MDDDPNDPNNGYGSYNTTHPLPNFEGCTFSSTVQIDAAELAALRKDAERYRWLLKNYARGDGYDAIDAALNDGQPEIQLSPAIDAAIDAAMQASVTSASA
jgi:hypothetical protein